MVSVLQADQQGRVDAVSNIQPNNTPTDQIAAMGDNKLSRDELMSIAQLGANAQAGFQSFGGRTGDAGMGLELSEFSGKFSEITTQFARGQIPQARRCQSV